jgi:hypothetical protein
MFYGNSIASEAAGVFFDAISAQRDRWSKFISATRLLSKISAFVGSNWPTSQKRSEEG